MQIQANFTAIAKSIFYDFYWLFLCLTSLALFLSLWLRLSFAISFRNKRKPVNKIAWQSKRFRLHNYITCEFPLYPRSKHGLSKNTLIFPTFSVALKTYSSYTSNCIVFDLNYLQRFSKKCPVLNICA